MASEPSSLPSLDELHGKLEGLWERYLGALHEYDTAKQQIAKHMSSAFMSLAVANYKSASGRRYGRDHYDQRMQASMRVETSLEDECPVYSISRTQSKVEAEPEHEDQDPGPELQEKPETEPEAASRSNDPLRWFGILVPPALRSTQRDFTACFEQGHVAQAAQAARQLRILEAEIRRVRKDVRRAERVPG